jgi:hypothetical protein
MTKPFHLCIPVAVLALALTGCQSSNSPTSSTPAASSSTHYAVPATTSPLMSVDPANIAQCDPGVVATVKWNTHAAEPSADMVEVWVGASSTELKLFAAGGGQAQAETGPWTHPGSHFVLKNKADGKVLADVTVGGPKCPG